MSEDKEVIVVTGFGPFGEHEVNASWEAVKQLPEILENYKIITQEIPVSYDYVDKNVPELWRKYKPKLMVHVGVSSFTNKITIETCANREGYEKIDIFGNCNVTGKVCSSNSGSDCIKTGINCEYICDKLNKETARTKISNFAGRYLCEYIYYTSLNIDKDRVLFIHVPPINKPYTIEQLTNGILEIIKCALEILN